MAINLHLPEKTDALRPTITVIGVGGAGGNAVNNMINANLEGVNFVVANTDAQALESALTERRIQLGINITRGLGAGASPEVGCAAAEEAQDEIAGHIEGSHMVFITAGMGGGTGTGAAPVVARLAKERGILTVGVVTKPFQFEGTHRMRLAEQGLRELQQYVDTLIVIPNQNLFRIANEKTTFAQAFGMADEVLHSGVRGVTDLMIMPGLINLDFADIRSVMREMGKAMMGTGEAEGPKRAIEAAEAAISNPLLDDVSMKGARGVLINITGGYDMTLFEADEAATRIREEVDPDANIIFGATFNSALEGKIRVSVVATGIDVQQNANGKPNAPAYEQSRFFGGKIGPAVSRGAETVKNLTVAPAARVIESLPAKEVTRPVVHQPLQEPKQAASATATAPRVVVSPAVQANSHTESAPSYSSYTNAESEMQTSTPQFASNQAFVSPAAAQPAQRSFFPSVEETYFEQQPVAASSGARISPREQVPSSQPRETMQTPDAGVQAGNAMSFFQRMAGVGRVLSSKPEQSERSAQATEKPRADVTERSVKTAEEDYYEIPAFLRRQAN